MQPIAVAGHGLTRSSIRHRDSSRLTCFNKLTGRLIPLSHSSIRLDWLDKYFWDRGGIELGTSG